MSRWPFYCDHSVTSADVRLSVGKATERYELRKEMILNDGGLHLSRAFLIIVNDRIYPTAHRITSHQPSIAGPQQVGHRGHIPQARIEPEIVAVFINDDWHSVVNRGCNAIRSRRQNRAGLQRFAVCVVPAIPYSCKREQLPVINFKAVRLLNFPCFLPFVKSIRKDQAPAKSQCI